MNIKIYKDILFEPNLKSIIQKFIDLIIYVFINII